MEFIYEKGRIYMTNADGAVIAEITFPIADGVATIDHTFVDGSLRGQGVAGKLVTAAANASRICSHDTFLTDRHPAAAGCLLFALFLF